MNMTLDQVADEGADGETARRIAIIDEDTRWLDEMVPSLEGAGYHVQRHDSYDIDHAGLRQYAPDLVVISGNCVFDSAYERLKTAAITLVEGKYAVFAMPESLSERRMRELFRLGCKDIWERPDHAERFVTQVGIALDHVDRANNRPYQKI